MTSAECPSCAQVCPVVSASVTVPVKCTRCGKSWFPDLAVYATDYSTPVVNTELMRASIAFRCAVNGGRFVVDLALWMGEARFRIKGSRVISSSNSGELSAPPPPPPVDASSFDMSGWTCLVCNHTTGRADVSHAYAQCGSCGELVCGGRMMTGPQGDTFACHPACGGGGLLSGSIQTYRAATPGDDAQATDKLSDRPAPGR
jgi:hypothetical protein